MFQFLSQIKHRFTNVIKRETRTDSDAGWVCRSRRNRERLEMLHRHKDTRETPAKDTETFDRNTISVKHALLILKNTVLFIRSLLPGGNGCDGLCVKAAPAQCFSSSDLQSPAPVSSVVLQLESLQPFLISDQLCHLRAASLNGADQLSKDPLTVLHCCLCRALLGHTEREASESVHSLSSYCCLTACSPQWASVGLKELQHWLLTDWLKRVLTESQTALQQPAVVLLLKTHLMRRYSLSQLLKLLLSLLDSLM